MTSEANLIAFAARYDIMAQLLVCSGRYCDAFVLANPFSSAFCLVSPVVCAGCHGRITAFILFYPCSL